MTMQYIVNKAGMQTSDMKFNTDVSFGMMASVFDSDDTVDYTTMFEPTASEYVKKGRGYIVASVGEASGALHRFFGKQKLHRTKSGTHQSFYPRYHKRLRISSDERFGCDG